MALQMAELNNYSCFRFTKASFFLSGLVFGHALAEYSFLGFLIVFIQENSDWGNVWYEAVVSTARDCFSAFLASFLAYTTRQRVRPLIMILVTHAIFIAGMLILLFRQKSPMHGIFYLGLALLSVDISAEEYMEEFLTELAVNQSKQGTDDAKKANNRIDYWWFVATIAGAFIGGVQMSRLPTSKQLYISAIMVGIGCILVYSYSICTNKGSSGDREVEKHELTGDHEGEKHELTGDHKGEKHELTGDHEGEKHELTGDHEGEKHELSPLLKFLPLWAPFLIYYVVDAAGSAFFDYEAYLYIIQKFSGIIVSRLIGYVLTKFYGEDQHVQQRIRLAKIIFGMLVCFLLCIDTWYVQAKRKSKGSLTFYLQFILLGIMKEMVEEMLGEYFCDQVPDQSMHHLKFAFNSFVEGMGRLLAVVIILVSRNWIGDKIEENGKVVKVKHSQLDKFFRTLAFMSLWALFMFVYLSNTCYLKKETEDHNDHLERLEEGRLTLSSNRPSGSSVNRDYWSIVRRRYIKERLGAKEKSS